MLPLLADLVRDDFPHDLAAFDVRSGEILELDAVPVLGVLPLHQSFVSFPAGVGGLFGKVVLCYWRPIHALSS